MKIPYFYLEAGNIQIFQPTNPTGIHNSHPIVIGEELLIYIRQEPQLSGNHLFLNGDYGKKSFSFLSDKKGSFSKFVQALKKHNGEQNV